MRVFGHVLCLLSLCHGLNSPQNTRTLASKHYKLVPYFAKRYVKKYCLKKNEKEEMIQCGYQGFMRACQKYDETKGAKISTYSSFWIRKYMDDYIKYKMKNDNITYLDDSKIHKIKNEYSNSILDEYNLESWEKELLIRKYMNRETFKSIAVDLNICRDTLRKKYEIIIKKIQLQDKKIHS